MQPQNESKQPGDAETLLTLSPEQISKRAPVRGKQAPARALFLGGHRNVRRIFIAMEILKPPVALRPGLTSERLR